MLQYHCYFYCHWITRQIIECHQFDNSLSMALALAWRHLESVSFDTFKRTFHLQPKSTLKYPIISAILQNESVLHKIRFIVDIFAWQAIAFKVMTLAHVLHIYT